MTTLFLFHVVMSAFIYQGQGDVNFAFHKSANQSTTLTSNGFNWTADKAVDGNSDGNNPDTSRTCSATTWTTSNQNHTWEVDIGFQIIVKTVTVYGRTDAEQGQLDGVRLYLGNTPGPWNYGHEFRNDPSSGTPLMRYVFKPDNVIARFISLMRAGQILIICEVIVEGTVNFALHKSAVQSTTLYYNNFYWTADKAVDGNSDGSDPENSMTCSSTTHTSFVSVNHTWEVDIGFQIIVKTITVYGRSDANNDNLSGFRLFIGNVSMPWRYNQDIPSNSSSRTKYVFKPNHAIASVISLMRFNNILVICEVTVEGECLDGNFSEFCNLTCGKCYAGQPCNKENGTCPLGCDQGWKGKLCKEGCVTGKYGYNCNETCGNCLNGNNSCSTINGNCSIGCNAGWQGDNCKKECDTGTYFYNCNETCGNCLNGNNSCDTSYGHCNNGCKAGWQGDNCRTKCHAGTYGFSCNETCGYCLNGNNSCLNMNGQCSGGCQVGLTGETCKSECAVGTYGFNCNETCGYCLNGNNSCSKNIGQCSGGCQSGWNGETCKSGTLRTVTTVDAGPNTGAIVGSVLAAVAVSIFAMVIIIVIVKNRRKKHNNETITDNVTTAAHYVNMVVGNPEKDITVSAIEEANLQRGMSTNNHSGVMEPDVPVHNVYEKLQDVTESIEAAYYTIDHNTIGYADDQEMESMEPSSTYVETLQSLESALKSVEEEISVLLDQKEKLLSKELETARANKLRDKWKKKDSDKDKDSTIVNFVQALQSIEEELRILEEKRKCLLRRKEILLRQELAKTT